MRSEFVHELVELAARDPRVVLLTGDLGYTVLEPFAERFPDRFFNAGVAEQNMLGMATGLADAGFVPFAYSIATFASMRAYEFVRNGAALHRLPVRVVGVGGGFDYGHNGVTHYALEDVGLMRLQPEMTVLVPADPGQAQAALRATASLDGPVYFRLGKQAAALPGLGGAFELGRMPVLGEPGDVLIVALGPAAAEALDAREILSARGVAAGVGVASTVSPAPVDDLVAALARASVAVTVESHYVAGGLGSLVAEVIAEHGLDARLVRCGVRSMPRGDTGSPAYLASRHGLSAAQISHAASRALSQATAAQPV